MAGKNVVILGAGIGGVIAANALRQRLGPEHRIVLIDRQGQFVFTPSLLWVMVGKRRPAQISCPLGRLLQPRIEVVYSEVQEIDPHRSRVRTRRHEFSYDYLVVALGADLAPERLPGYAGAAHNIYASEGVVTLWSALQQFDRGRVVVLVSATPYKCPAAPYEAAMLLDDALRRRGIRPRYRVEVFTPEPQPMPVAGPAIGNVVAGVLASKGIPFHPIHQIDHIEPGSREIVFTDSSREDFDLLAVVPPHQPPRAVRESPLANQAGWVPVDKNTLRTRFENVYAIGDVTTISLANGKPLPKAGVFAHAQGEVVAARIAAEIKGGREADGFNGEGYCWIEMGARSAGFASGHFYAEPDPVVQLRSSGRAWHWGKVVFEHYWLGQGLGRRLARLALNLSARLAGVPARL